MRKERLPECSAPVGEVLACMPDNLELTPGTPGKTEGEN